MSYLVMETMISKKKKKSKWQIPEAWETEVVEADWVGIPWGVRDIMKKVGDDPIKILKWGIKNGDGEVVEWALENGGDINGLDKNMLKGLSRNLSLDFVKKIVESYVTNEKMRHFIQMEILRREIGVGNEQGIREILDKGARVEDLNEVLLRMLIENSLVTFLKEIIEKYVTSEKAKQRIYQIMLSEGADLESKSRVIEALENGANINKVDESHLMRLGESLPVSFVEKIIRDYIADEKAKRAMYSGMIARGIQRGKEGIIIKALKKGGEIGKLNDYHLQELCWRFPFDFVKRIAEDYSKDDEIKRRLLLEILKCGIDNRRRDCILWALQNGARVSGATERICDILLGPD